ncbi:MAG: tetratricopeptide repeat protein [bacterium]|nr:tetratricopeptide repeat protein [bacterium]
MIQSALVQKAIKAALQSEWSDAIQINQELLEQNPHDLESMNRLARAYLELGDINKSKKTYKEVLTIDPYNVIALKNVKRFQAIKGSTTEISNKIVKSLKTAQNSSAHITFIEEPGKTKVVQVVRPASPSTLFTLHSGEKALLVPKARSIQIMTEGNVYVGRLPDDLAFQLQYFIKNGNTYDAFIKQVLQNSVYVFIREVKRSEKFTNRPTFSLTNDKYISASPVNLESPDPIEEDTDGNEEDQ